MDHAAVQHDDQPFVVMRTATMEEWIADVKEKTGLTDPPADLLETMKQSFYYEVSLD